MSMNPFRVSANAFIVKDDQVLLIKFDDANGVHYNLPGGGIDAGESVVTGLARECREEACADVIVRDLLLAWQYIPEMEDFKFGDKQKLGLIFKAELKPGSEPQLPMEPDPHQVGVEWIPLERIFAKEPLFPLFPEVHQTLKEALDKNRSAAFLERSSIMSWEDYFKKFTGRPPRPQLVKALEFISSTKGHAVELGSGAGRDALHLLQEGWSVTAIEKETAGLKMLQRDLPAELQIKLTTLESSFEDLRFLPKNRLTYASFSLPFCRPEAFSSFWKVLVDSLEPQGFFVGNFFGPEDDWAKQEDMTNFSEKEIRELLKGFDILDWHEKKEMAPTAAGPLKHWHVYTVVAQRKV